MVTLDQARASNAQISTALPSGLVAVFTGATSGIGEAALKRFTQQAAKPRIYFVGRSKESGNRVTAELQKLNPGGQYNFISADLSSLKAVDDVCHQIKNSESAINLLFMSSGTMLTGKDTSEGLNYTTAVSHYARFRFIANLLPVLQNATSLRRVVSVLAGSKEGKINTADVPSRSMHPLSPKGLAHLSTTMTLGLEHFAQQAPTVSFVHSFPGFVKTNIGNDVKGAGVAVVRGIWNAIYPLVGPLMATSLEETGERHTFFATSAMFPPAADTAASGVPLAKGLKTAPGADGKSGSGVYSLNKDAEAAPAKVTALLAEQRTEVGPKVWKHVEEEFVRVTGTASA